MYDTYIGNGIDILQRKDQQTLRVILSFATYTVNAFISLIRLNTVLYILESNFFDCWISYISKQFFENDYKVIFIKKSFSSTIKKKFLVVLHWCL